MEKTVFIGGAKFKAALILAAMHGVNQYTLADAADFDAWRIHEYQHKGIELSVSAAERFADCAGVDLDFLTSR